MWEYEKNIKKKNSTWAYNKYSISNEFDTKRFSFFSFSHDIIQTSVEYLKLFLFVTHFTSITRRYQL